jgi:hypothetical protein
MGTPLWITLSGGMSLAIIHFEGRDWRLLSSIGDVLSSFGGQVMRTLYLAGLLTMTVVAANGVANAQYSVEITRRPNSSVTMGPYTSSILSRWGVNTGSTVGPPSARRGINYYARWPGYVYDYGYTTTYGYGAPIVGYDVYPYPVYGYPYGYTWPYYVDSGAGVIGPYIAPPVYVPPEQLGFGPQAVKRFMGVDQPQRPIVNNNVIVAPRENNAGNDDRLQFPEAGGNADRPAVRESNADARERSHRFVEFGDAQLAAGDLATAYDRYKKAAAAAPELAEPYFRQGHTLAALNRFDEAAAAFRRGLDLQPNWPVRGFRLSELYRDKDATRTAVLAAVKNAADAAVDSRDVQFAAGVEFFLDGQPQQAAQYLQRAKAAGEPARYVEPFLKLLPKAVDPAELDI